MPFAPLRRLSLRPGRRAVAGVLVALGLSLSASDGMVPAAVLREHVARFNAMEPERVVNAVPNEAAADWLEAHVPRFACADAEVEEIYWFRWWALRKHLRRDAGSGRWVLTEFITRARPVSSALGHHLMETRWLRDAPWVEDYVRYWLRGNAGCPPDHFHRYSQWLAHALWQRWLVTGDTAALTELLDELIDDFRRWEEERGRPDGLFWQHDVWDAMEESISGGRRVKNVRPTISVYMYGNALALAEIARLAGRPADAGAFAARAERLRQRVETTLWNEERVFFCSVTEELRPIPVREAIGFIPWYFGLPTPGRGYERAWAQIRDEAGFRAPYGLTTAERRDPTFRTRGTGTCEWDGAVWPFATSQTLTALGNVLRDYPQTTVSRDDHFDAFRTYVRSHRYDGRPYIGEYLDERDGRWLKGPDPRSEYYNHSTFADLLITGVVGLRPRADGRIEVDPLLPEGKWDWFALEDVPYRGRRVAVIWDRDGTRFGQGAGLQVRVDGGVVARAPRLERIQVEVP
jgi:hypothetical protein